jgi:hypothetical protein
MFGVKRRILLINMEKLFEFLVFLHSNGRSRASTTVCKVTDVTMRLVDFGTEITHPCLRFGSYDTHKLPSDRVGV